MWIRWILAFTIFLVRSVPLKELASFPKGPLSSTDTFELNDGLKMPIIGVGTFRIPPGNDTYSSVLAALKIGYRMVDTAEYYQNEADVGKAIRDSGIPRSEVFVTTKISSNHHNRYDEAIKAGMESNAKLGLDYIDLLLIHSPRPGRIVECYDAILHLRDQGIVRSVGVSNFGTPHLEALKNYCRPTPAVNQFELSPLTYRERNDLVEYCGNAGILVQPYGSLLKGRKDLLSLSRRIAAAHNKTEAQVMLRWALDKSFQVIPKSTHVSYLAENFHVFDFTLSQEETGELDTLPQTQLYGNDPSTIPVDAGMVSGCQLFM
mmetsp:Transcript_137725/g.243331  ORF Transcript_137725/g.243331 Transcript_137725/m.243331 type:complete len:319 (-) Transcript_137725:345-1301(-)